MARNTGTDPALFNGTPRFALVREIGSGGMGIVFEALDRERSSRVALKTLNRVNPTDLYRFKKEFRCLESLVHPNLVTLYELIAEKGHWFFTMELVHGEDFLTYVARSGQARRRGNNPGKRIHVRGHSLQLSRRWCPKRLVFHTHSCGCDE